ncbi:gamma-glutamyltransferase [Mycolicibacterium chlorophenolicum]|uniref:Putative gamma-glutamyltransferase YwrD n=1 Tax=Mycolicibacterium chlorophenolicum TaxID=37916 RepID=A0A0J6WJS2_9MYCO|nr:gamma-glutamyltransferase [Mycolicibacterium chlorophenolicum]KMO82854.1 putative gamma-glutamyltransferase YwrD [Mycolicibacterium chlorophenolicum]
MPQSGHRATLASGAKGAASTAHPLATQAAIQMLEQGGSAADAAVAAQAVICVVLPQAAGLGGDLLALVHDRDQVAAVNGTGLSPRGLDATPHDSGGTSVTVPGLVDGWATMSARWGRLPLDVVLAPAIELARDGIVPDASLLESVDRQRARLEDGGAGDWSLLSAATHGGPWLQPELAGLLERIADHGRDAFYSGSGAAAVVDAVRRCGGSLAPADLSDHHTPCPPPVAVDWGAGRVHVQPPMSQGVLLAMALQQVRRLHAQGVPVEDHLLVEVTGAAFEHRSSCGSGASLLDLDLSVDLERASGRAGPRAYLHTAGVATVDATGQVVSSLVSVFDDFGSGVFVPELGIVLNNRAAGFTDGDNAAAPGKRPVHTLAPAMVTSPAGVLGIATPGADGQVQTLLQVLAATTIAGTPLADAVGALRWRSQDGDLLIEEGHPGSDALSARGHRVVPREAGADVFGAVVAAGTDPGPYAIADWRRQTDTRGSA